MAINRETSRSAYSVQATERGLAIERLFTRPGLHPFDEIEWETRDAHIGDPAR